MVKRFTIPVEMGVSGMVRLARFDNLGYSTYPLGRSVRGVFSKQYLIAVYTNDILFGP